MFRSEDGPYSLVHSYLKQAEILEVLEAKFKDFHDRANKIIICDCRVKRGRAVSMRKMTVASLIRKFIGYWQIVDYLKQWLINHGMKQQRALYDMSRVTMHLALKLRELHYVCSVRVMETSAHSMLRAYCCP